VLGGLWWPTVVFSRGPASLKVLPGTSVLVPLGRWGHIPSFTKEPLAAFIKPAYGVLSLSSILFIYLFIYLFMCLFGDIGVWTQDFVLVSQVFYCLSCTYRSFCPGSFGDRVSLFAQAGLDHDPPLLLFNYVHESYFKVHWNSFKCAIMCLRLGILRNWFWGMPSAVICVLNLPQSHTSQVEVVGGDGTFKPSRMS
jgi:hypothetical protein